MTTTVGFVGLGIMGGPMAANLVKAGFDVIGYNRSPEPIQRLVEQGGRGAGSLAEAVRDADVVVTIVPDSPDVEAVALGEDGDQLDPQLRPGRPQAVGHDPALGQGEGAPPRGQPQPISAHRRRLGGGRGRRARAGRPRTGRRRAGRPGSCPGPSGRAAAC